MEEEKIEKSGDAGNVDKVVPLDLDVAQRLLTLETKILDLEARIVLLEKQTIEASPTLVAKQPHTTIYGSNRRIK